MAATYCHFLPTDIPTLFPGSDYAADWILSIFSIKNRQGVHESDEPRGAIENSKNALKCDSFEDNPSLYHPIDIGFVPFSTSTPPPEAGFLFPAMNYIQEHFTSYSSTNSTTFLPSVINIKFKIYSWYQRKFGKRSNL
ncbi:hypothetical protein HMI54_009032 [Coelomomyces lativittatus]|nr:hypothetical protein HMI54_009032 [Coelomomyces lativittatus]KAJ1510954.1 hypothetical protein HMI56_005994 [Coelomomyces lativittatus]